ncbi:MAG: TonB-dependent receptor [Gemmatimonadaceae bacterium]|nr:TonB-dependent receptor [Gemmatimonadaceae bacterium]
MLAKHSVLGFAALLALASALPTRAAAQGVTTGGIAGTVTDNAGRPVADAQVELRNPASGSSMGTTTRSGGQYQMLGLLPDGNYILTVRRIGFAPAQRSPLRVTLGQTSREDVVLEAQAAVLEGVMVTGTRDPIINATKTGTSTTVSDSALARLPTLNRNFQDFVQLVPQVSTAGAVGLSGAGVNLRQNVIQIDGAQSGDMFGLGTSGQPGAQANAKSIPLDAVKEYQVLLSPFDVRQGNFGGLLINAVTRSGTNALRGSVYYYTRDEGLTRSQPYLNDYSQQQYGGTLGGPILRDRLHFFGSGEVQRRKSPTAGSYIGAPDQYVSQAQIDDIATRIAAYGLTEPGTGEQLQIENPTGNFFGRIDANLPFRTRAVFRHNYASADRTSFGRGSATLASPNFALTSNRYLFSSVTKSTVAEFITNLPRGLFNEFLLNHSTTKDFRTVPVNFPQITVRGITRTDNPAQTANFVLGTETSSQGNALDQRTFELTNNLTVPLGNHAVTFGTKNLFYESINLFANNSRGNWTFATPAALSAGTPLSYLVSAPAPTDPFNGLATIRANTHALYVQDVWTFSPRLTITAGMRHDKPSFRTKPPENDIVFTQYGRHTSSVPTQGQFSPRIGFNWDVTGDQVNQLRGGIGSFTGSVPFVYLSNAFGNSGLSGFSSINCNNTTANTNLAPPIFTAERAANPPTSCDLMTAGVRTVGGGAAISGPAAGAAVATIDPDFKYPKYLKGSLGFDRRFGSGIIGTIEGLFTRSQDNAFYQNLALQGPLDVTDRNGRVLYGRLLATGASPNTIGNRTQVLDVTNSSGDYSYSITGQLQKSFTTNFEGMAAYTFMRARDVTSTTSSTQGSNFRYQRSVSGRLDDMSITRSKYDQPHRIIMTGTYRLRTATDVSFIYTGNSGSPFDFVYGTTGGLTGDLNADGQSQNDLMYVPLDATNQNEILFTGYNSTNTVTAANAVAMAQAFEKFISETPCLNEARGTILTRNACRNPWVNQVDVSIAQSLGRLGGARFKNVQARLDVINFGNLLNKNWGSQEFSSQNNTCGAICSATVALTHTGNLLPVGTPTGGNSPDARGIFTFDPTYRLFSSENLSSNYTMQLSVRYSF